LLIRFRRFSSHFLDAIFDFATGFDYFRLSLSACHFVFRFIIFFFATATIIVALFFMLPLRLFFLVLMMLSIFRAVMLFDVFHTLFRHY